MIFIITAILNLKLNELGSKYKHYSLVEDFNREANLN